LLEESFLLDLADCFSDVFGFIISFAVQPIFIVGDLCEAMGQFAGVDALKAVLAIVPNPALQARPGGLRDVAPLAAATPIVLAASELEARVAAFAHLLAQLQRPVTARLDCLEPKRAVEGFAGTKVVLGAGRTTEDKT
jgi:hypothetical protein